MGVDQKTFNKLTPQMERSMSHVLLVLNVGSTDAAMVETAKLKTSWFVSLQFRTQDISRFATRTQVTDRTSRNKLSLQLMN
jgi:hypothetical protein